MIAEEGLRKQLADRTGTRPTEWFLMFKARYGMSLIFSAIERRHGQVEIITQAFTCCTAVAPIIFAGLEPRYADIRPETLSIDCDVLGNSQRAKALVMQHTLGIIDTDSDAKLAAHSRANNLLLIEDSAHCLARMSRGCDGNPLADVSIHSFGVEKMLPQSYFGGAIWVNPNMADEQLRSSLVKSLERAEQPSRKILRRMRLYRNQARLLNHLPPSISGKLASGLESTGLYEAPISRNELQGEMPGELFSMGEMLAQLCLNNLQCLEGNEQRRQRIVKLYRDAFLRAGYDTGHVDLVVPEAIMATEFSQPLLAFPVIFYEEELAERAIEAIREIGAHATRWYRPLLFPGVGADTPYLSAVSIEELTRSQEISSGICCLPTDISEHLASRIVRLVISLRSSKWG